MSLAKITNARRQEMLDSVNVLDQFISGVAPGKPWGSIVEFATSPRYCGINLYPRQETILKIIYLEVDNLTAYDKAVIDKWRKGFSNKNMPIGIQEDIYERMEHLRSNGYTHFPKTMAVMGRRAGKGMIGGVMAAERIANLVSLDDPQRHYDIDRGKPIQIQNMGTSTSQAKRDLFNDINRVVTSCEYLQPYVTKSTSGRLEVSTPADIRRLTTLLDSIDVETSGSSIIATPLSSTSTGARGGATYFLAFDEFAHLIAGTGGPRSSEEIWNAALPSLDQFGLEGMIFLPSSPYTKGGQFFKLYQEGSILLPEYLAKQELTVDQVGEILNERSEELPDSIAYGDPELVIFQLPSWEPYLDYQHMPKLVGRQSPKKPIQYPPATDNPNGIKVIAQQRRDPQWFKVEKQAQFAEVQNAYLDPVLVDRIFLPFGGRKLVQQKSGPIGYRYTAHCDPGKTKANFAIAIGHAEPGPEDDFGNKWNHAVIDYTHVWRPGDFAENAYEADDGSVAKPTIDFAVVLDDLKKLLLAFPSMSELTFDHWQSQLMIDELRRFVSKNRLTVKINEVEFTETHNRDLMEAFKLELEMDWIHAPRDRYFDGDCLLEQELKFLSKQGNRIDRQHFGPVTTKDLSDCFDDQTEVLTDSGWKLFRDVSDGERIGTVDEDGRLEFQHPTHRIAKRYDGKMLEFQSHKANFCVTPTHRMLSQGVAGKPVWENYSFVAAEDLPYVSRLPIAPKPKEEDIDFDPVFGLGPTRVDVQEQNLAVNHRMGWGEDQDGYLLENYHVAPMHEMVSVLKRSRSSIYNRARLLGLKRGQIGDRLRDRPAYPPEVKMSDFAKFVGFWLGDGTKIKPGKQGWKVSISQSKPDGVRYLHNLFSRMGWDYVAKEQRGRGTLFSVKYAGLREYLFTLQEGDELRLPDNFIDWPYKARLGFWEGLTKSDGDFKHGRTLVNTSKLLLDDAQRLLLSVGIPSTILKCQNSGRKLFIRGRETESRKDTFIMRALVNPTYNVRKDRVQKVDYSGMVYCFTVPNGTIITRRHGKVLVAGNCVQVVSDRLLNDQLVTHRQHLLETALLQAGLKADSDGSGYSGYATPVPQRRGESRMRDFGAGLGLHSGMQLTAEERLSRLRSSLQFGGFR